MNDTIINRLINVCDTKITIKCSEKEISVPKGLMINFDIYDTIESFDNIIEFPKNLVDMKYVSLFFSDIKDILLFRIYNYNADTIANILIICHFLQSSEEIINCMEERIYDAFQVSDLIRIILNVSKKINKLIFEKSYAKICSIVNSQDISELFKFVENLRNTHVDKFVCRQKDNIHSLLHNKYLHKSKIVKIMCKAKCPCIYTLNINYISACVEDWKSHDINSDISNIFVHDLEKIDINTKIPINTLSYNTHYTFMIINKLTEDSYENFSHRLEFGYILNKNNNIKTLIYAYYNFFQGDFDVYIDEKFLNSDHILVITL